MIRAIRMAALFLGICVLLSAGRGFAVDSCVKCDCKVVKAWRETSDTKTYGLRMPDPNDKDRTLVANHAPVSDGIEGNGPMRAAKCDDGMRTGKSKTYDKVQYKAAGTVICAVGTAASGRVEVTLQAADFDDFSGTGISIEQFLCVVLPPPGGGGQ